MIALDKTRLIGRLSRLFPHAGTGRYTLILPRLNILVSRPVGGGCKGDQPIDLLLIVAGAPLKADGSPGSDVAQGAFDDAWQAEVFRDDGDANAASDQCQGPVILISDVGGIQADLSGFEAFHKDAAIFAMGTGNKGLIPDIFQADAGGLA